MINSNDLSRKKQPYFLFLRNFFLISDNFYLICLFSYFFYKKIPDQMFFIMVRCSVIFTGYTVRETII